MLGRIFFAQIFKWQKKLIQQNRHEFSGSGFTASTLFQLLFSKSKIAVMIRVAFEPLINKIQI